MSIKNELNELGAANLLHLHTAAKIINTNKIPDHYFESFAESVFIKMEIENIAPQLALLAKKNTMINITNSLPENYFGGLEAAVFNAVKPKAARVVSIVNIKKTFSQPLKVWAAAAVAAALVGISIFIGYNNNINNTNQSMQNVAEGKSVPHEILLSSVSQSEAIAYLQDHAQEIDETMLANKIAIAPQHLYDINDKEVAKYLDENGDVE